jgi:fibronectin type 3 domain-containing protein
MTTQQISRFIIGISAFTLIVFVLFSGTITSASKGDRSAPTVPANLMVTAIGDTTVSLKWQGSSDNSGKLSYRVRITNLNNSAYNSLATVAQTQTSYTAKYLATSSSYTFAVYAVDANGNRSAESNTATAQTLGDTTAPSAPVLQAVVLSPSQVQLTWTEAVDSNYCCTYGVNLNGSRITQNISWVGAPAGKLSAVIRHIQPGSANTFSISAMDYAGGPPANSNVVNIVTPPSNDTLPPSAPTNLRLVQHDGCAEVWIGWTEATDNVDPQGFIEYEIYVNGVISPMPVSSGIDVDFVYGTASGENIFTVKAVDRSGNSSSASRPLKLLLWPC